MSEKIMRLVTKAPKIYWLSCLDYFDKEIPQFEFVKRDISFIVEECEKCIQNCKINQFLNWMVVGIKVNEDQFIELIKKRGSLRSSKYKFKSGSLVVKSLLKLKEKLPIHPKHIKYLNSIIELNRLCPYFDALNQKIVSNIKVGKEKLLREILLSIDFIFMLQALNRFTDRTEIVDNQIQSISPENLAEAASYIFHLYHEVIGEPGVMDMSTNISNIKVDQLIIFATKIRFVFELEVKVDAYNYSLVSNADLLRILPPSKEFEKALRLGYVQTESQSALHNQLSRQDDNSGLEDLSKILYDEIGHKIIELKEDFGHARYVMKFPLIPKVIEFVASDSFFSEEAILLEECMHEWSVDIDALLKFEVCNEVNLHDVIKAQRLIKLFRGILLNHFKSRLDTETEVILQSLVPVFSSESISELFGAALGKCPQKLIDFLSHVFAQNGVFDLQYQPILKMGNHYSIPFNLMANSNLLRNSIQISKRRFYSDGKDDPISKQIHDTLGLKSTNVGTNVNYSWGNIKGEIDNIAFIDGYLFVFECKNPNLPCSPHEARTSFDYVNKAARQLEQFRNCFNDKEFRTDFFGKLGWDVSDPKLVTGIIMSNRMFLGHRLGDHPVRGSRETIHFIESGVVEMGDEKRCFWENDYFQAQDLYNFLEKDVIHSHLVDAMQRSDITYIFGEKRIVSETYVFDMLKAAKAFGFKEAEHVIASLRGHIS